jgi:hypothetical protein
MLLPSRLTRRVLRLPIRPLLILPSSYRIAPPLALAPLNVLQASAGTVDPKTTSAATPTVKGLPTLALALAVAVLVVVHLLLHPHITP